MNTTDPTIVQAQQATSQVATPPAPQAQGGGSASSAVATTGGSGTVVKVTTADLALIKTPSGKGLEAFTIPEKLKNEDPELVDYIIRSESMKDPERQYWFNLSEIMNNDQTEKLRDILVRERNKLAEIDAKYGKKTIDPIKAAKQAQKLAAQRSVRQAELQKKEAAFQAKEAQKESDILAELEGL